MEWMTGRGGTAAALIFAATLVASGTGLAQTVDIGGHAAFYIPHGSLINDPPIEKRMQAAIMTGVDVVVWTSGRLGFAGKVGYAPSSVAIIQPGSVSDRDAAVILASARVLFAVTPLTIGPDASDPPWSVYVGAGGGLASRSGGVWSYASGRTSPALVLSAGVQSLSGPRFVMRIELEDHISRAHFNAGAAGETTPQMHQDLAVAVSIAFRARRR